MSGPTQTGLLRPIELGDHDAVLRLNDANVELLAPMGPERLRDLLGWADLGHVIEHDGAFAGFVLTFVPGTAYDSVNYRWFAQAYADFYYLDRIVLTPSARRRGLGTRVYAAIEERARPHGRMVLEVNLDPPNEGSLAFHAGRGYRQVGTQSAGGHVVSLLALELD